MKRLLVCLVLVSGCAFAVLAVCSRVFASERPSVAFGNDYVLRCAEFVDGKTTGSGSDPEGFFQFAYCAGYTEGLEHALLLADGNICLPSADVQTVQVARIISKWIKDHPEQAHKLTTILAQQALRKAFPCATK
ncbi:MAG: hypothetical protein LAN37_09740 [Acidobacteriia bacterium]|nr:hypothetical protein [Terriglobia bacterium]